MRKESASSWFRWIHFPLFPRVEYRPGDDENTWSCSIRWLLFSVWTIDSITLSLEVDLSLEDFQFWVRLPYLVTRLRLPLFPVNLSMKLWRKPRKLK